MAHGKTRPEDGFKKKLRILSQKEVTSWPNKSGTTTLYECTAVDEDGKQWPPPDDGRPLRTFAELDLKVLMEYDIEPYEHKEYGKSFTLKRPRHNSTKRLQALEDQFEALASRVAALEARVGAAPAEMSEPTPQGPGFGKPSVIGD